jgi:hypothetical protein
MQSGANPAAVQRIMRHSDPRITTEVYGHLAPGYLRDEIDRLQFGAPPALPTAPVAKAADTTPASRLGATLVSASTVASPATADGAPKLQSIPGGNMVGATGFEPAASWSRTARRRQSAATLRELPNLERSLLCAPGHVEPLRACRLPVGTTLAFRLGRRPAQIRAGAANERERAL